MTLAFLEEFTSLSIPAHIVWHSPNDGTAEFHQDGILRWSVWFSIEHGQQEHGRDALGTFIVRDEPTGIEIIVRDPLKARDEPALCHISDCLRRDIELTRPDRDSELPDPQPDTQPVEHLAATDESVDQASVDKASVNQASVNQASVNQPSERDEQGASAGADWRRPGHNHHESPHVVQGDPMPDELRCDFPSCRAKAGVPGEPHNLCVDHSRLRARGFNQLEVAWEYTLEYLENLENQAPERNTHPSLASEVTIPQASSERALDHTSTLS